MGKKCAQKTEIITLNKIAYASVGMCILHNEYIFSVITYIFKSIKKKNKKNTAHNASM